MAMAGSTGDRRLSFDNVPEIYGRARPSYPDALFNEIFAYLQQPSPVLRPAAVEIGPGTGQATKPLLDRGAQVTALEPGPQLAEFVRKKFRDAYPGQLEVVNVSFEDSALSPATYDLVVVATAFHWLDPNIRLEKCRSLLRAGGAIAIIGTNQVRSAADRGFFDRVFPIYRRYRPNGRRTELPGADVVPAEHEEIDASGLFDSVTLRRYPWDQTYPTAAYADLVRSYSDTQMMEPTAQESLIADLCRVIDTEFHGTVVRPLVVTLTLGRRPVGRA